MLTDDQLHLAGMPAIPPLTELRRRCRQVTRTVRELSLGGHHLTLHDIRPLYKQSGPTVEHEHSFYEGHILLSGIGHYAMGAPQTLGPGGTLLHGPHTPHAWREAEQPCLRLLIWFSMDPPVAVPRPSRWPEWPDILTDLALLFADAGQLMPGWHHRVASRLTVVLSRLLAIAEWPSSPEPPQWPRQHFVAEVEQFLRDNLARPLTLDDIADHVGVSQRTLCRQFLDLTGATVMERLATLRMDMAAALLLETDDTLAAIGDRVGMPDPSYFCRRFRLHFHVTPNAYRAQMDGTTPSEITGGRH